MSFTFGLVDQDQRRGGAGVPARARSCRSSARGLISGQARADARRRRRDADQGKVAATFVLPPGFSAAIATGRPAATLRVIGNVDALDRHAGRRSRSRSRSRTRPTRSRIAAAAAGAAAVTSPSRGRRCRSRSRSPTSRRATASSTPARSTPPGWPCSSCSSPSSSGSRASSTSAATARSRGCSSRRSAASAVLVGKLLTSLVLGFLSMAVLAVATHFLLGAHWGNALGVAMLIVAGVLAATARDDARRHARPDARPGAVLAGDGGARARHARRRRSSRSPRPAGRLAALSLVTPQAWFLRGIENMTGGAGASAVLGPVARDPRVRGGHRRARVRAAHAGWWRDEGAHDRRDRPAPAAALAGQHLLPVRAADADHPAARRGVRRPRRRRGSACSAGTAGTLARQFVTALRAQPGTAAGRRYRAAGALQHAVARGDVDAGLVIPAGYDARLRSGQRPRRSASSRGPTRSPSSCAPRSSRSRRAGARDRGRPARSQQSGQAPVRSGARAARRRGGRAAPAGDRRAERAGRRRLLAPASGRFEPGASTQLLLFIFLNSLTGAAWLIETRRLGIARRMLSTPTSTRDDRHRPAARPARGRARAGADHRARVAAVLRRRSGAIRSAPAR